MGQGYRIVVVSNHSGFCLLAYIAMVKGERERMSDKHDEKKALIEQMEYLGSTVEILSKEIAELRAENERLRAEADHFRLCWDASCAERDELQEKLSKLPEKPD